MHGPKRYRDGPLFRRNGAVGICFGWACGCRIRVGTHRASAFQTGLPRSLLLGRYLGNVLVVAANILYLVAGSWIIFGVKTNVWGAGFLVSSICTIFIFSVLLAVLVLVGVLWDSSAVAIMVTFAIMIITPILAQKATIERLLSSEWSRVVIAHAVLRAAQDFGRELDYQTPDPEPACGELDAGVWSTALFGAVVHGLGLWRFQRRASNAPRGALASCGLASRSILDRPY